MSDNKEASVVHSVNETIREHTRAGVHDDWEMSDDYGYELASIKLFLNSVYYKLKRAGYTFSYTQGFGTALLSKTLEETKVAIDAKTT